MIKKYITPPCVHPKSLAIFGIILFNAFGFRSQSIHFNYTDGTNATYNLVDLRKITFDADLMNVHLWDGTIYSWNVSTIGYYQYNDSPLNIQDLLNAANILDVSVFPNPSNSILNLRFCLPTQDFITYQMFDNQGLLVFERTLGKLSQFEHQETIDVSNLPKGTYLLRLHGENHSVTKTVLKN